MHGTRGGSFLGDQGSPSQKWVNLVLGRGGGHSWGVEGSSSQKWSLLGRGGRASSQKWSLLGRGGGVLVPKRVPFGTRSHMMSQSDLPKWSRYFWDEVLGRSPLCSKKINVSLRPKNDGDPLGTSLGDITLALVPKRTFLGRGLFVGPFLGRGAPHINLFTT